MGRSLSPPLWLTLILTEHEVPRGQGPSPSLSSPTAGGHTRECPAHLEGLHRLALAPLAGDSSNTLPSLLQHSGSPLGAMFLPSPAGEWDLGGPESPGYSLVGTLSAALGLCT